jgi:hypothetical protein
VAFSVIRIMWFVFFNVGQKGLNNPIAIGESNLYDLLKPVLSSYHCSTNCKQGSISKGETSFKDQCFRNSAYCWNGGWKFSGKIWKFPSLAQNSIDNLSINPLLYILAVEGYLDITVLLNMCEINLKCIGKTAWWYKNIYNSLLVSFYSKGQHCNTNWNTAISGYTTVKSNYAFYFYGHVTVTTQQTLLWRTTIPHLSQSIPHLWRVQIILNRHIWMSFDAINNLCCACMLFSAHLLTSMQSLIHYYLSLTAETLKYAQ